MTTIELNGATLILTEETAAQILQEVAEIEEEKRRKADRFGAVQEAWAALDRGDWDLFSDIWKDIFGYRPPRP